MWEIIESAKSRSGGDCSRQVSLIQQELGKLPPDEILSFGLMLNEEIFFNLHRLRLWGAANVLRWMVNEDSFEFFRGWIVAQGRDLYETALRDPDDLADFEEVCSLAGNFAAFQCQGMLDIHYQPYLDLTGEEPKLWPDGAVEYEEILQSDLSQFEDAAVLERYYPKLIALVRSAPRQDDGS